jgi:hypothetical protein
MDNMHLEDVRRVLLEKFVLNFLIDLDDKVFENAVVHSMIFSVSKKNIASYIVKCTKNGFNEFYEIPIEYFKEQDYLIFDIRSYEFNNLIQKLKLNSKRFQDVIDLKQTIKTGDDSRYIVAKSTKKSHKPILRGKDIGKYTKNWNGLYVDYGPHLANQIRYDIFEQPKILIREAGKEIIASFDDENYYIMSSLYNGILKDEKFDIKYILALINSKIYQFLLNLITLDKTKGAFTKARIFHYYNLPVKNSSKNVQKQLNQFVTKIIQQKNQGIDTTSLEQEINHLVYKLYELTYDEVKVIDPEFSLSKTAYEAIKLE